jgi:hypothetical protein
MGEIFFIWEDHAWTVFFIWEDCVWTDGCPHCESLISTPASQLVPMLACRRVIEHVIVTANVEFFIIFFLQRFTANLGAVWMN